LPIRDIGDHKQQLSLWKLNGRTNGIGTWVWFSPETLASLPGDPAVCRAMEIGSIIVTRPRETAVLITPERSLAALSGPGDPSPAPLQRQEIAIP
jgi:hypothetical protein